ncbi:GNAT family N-acetyltransferase [Bacillus wiedmannii]|uniref:GNAT family N-acetyltransferase n=1 Tax=Bacillus wiedmannii TaxID=1890302 RepID=UPI000BEF97B3|nr:GNAT family N-acetyltransferase [Bacillus wiedmannii]MDP1459961.1 GNAT family N-acetyltransferase [Bacillus wiedmannii]PEJ62244.1 hypothetical protein CN685_26385 [Bacillus wiedmannii]
MNFYKLGEDNLLIREINENDIEVIRKWRNQEQIRKYFINNHYINQNQQQEWFKNYLYKNDDIMFMIEETLEFQEGIGTVALYNINQETQSVEFGRLMIGNPAATGKGFGKQAAILACKYAFEILNMEKIYLNVLPYNMIAIKVYENIGFVMKNNNTNNIYMLLSKEGFREF